MVASAGPARLIAGSEEGVDLGLGEVGDEVAFGSLVRDREQPLDRRGVLRVVKRHVCEQRVHRREAVVAAADAVAASFLEVLQERGDQRRVELCDVQLAGFRSGPLGGELQQQPERLAVGGIVFGLAPRCATSRSVKYACIAGASALIAPLRTGRQTGRPRAPSARATRTSTNTYPRG